MGSAEGDNIGWFGTKTILEDRSSHVYMALDVHSSTTNIHAGAVARVGMQAFLGQSGQRKESRRLQWSQRRAGNLLRGSGLTG